MEKKELEKFKKLLISLREEILMVITHEDEANMSREVIDEVDQATELIEQQMGSFMSSNFHQNLKKVDDAIQRINRDEYGFCQECGVEISKKRLEVLPLAHYCVKCQEEIENTAVEEYEPEEDTDNF